MPWSTSKCCASINHDDPTACIRPRLDLAAQLLREHRLVAFPTDTVYGLGTLAFDGPTVLKLYVAKERPPEKAIPILIADIADLDQVAIDVPPMAYRLMETFWPGALTIVVPKQPHIPIEVSTTNTVAVRMPDLDLARDLHAPDRAAGRDQRQPIGRANPRTAQEVLDQLAGRIDAIVDGGADAGRRALDGGGLHAVRARHPA